MGLRQLVMFLPLQCGDRLHTSESVVYGRQILTTKVDLRAVRVNFTNHTHFGSLEVVCRSSETQLQVSQNLN